MAHTTYHSKHKMDHQNIHQLSFYGEVPKICNVIKNIADSDDSGGTEDGGDDEGDGNSRSQRSRLTRQERIRQLLNQVGGVGHTTGPRTDTGEGYLLRCERDGWKLRNVKGLTEAKYKKYSATPLHFMCASQCFEGIILLLQNGSKDKECTFHGTRSQTCRDMLADAPRKLLAAYDFWSLENPVWKPDNHHCFTDSSKWLIMRLLYGNKKHAHRLCNDLLFTAVQFIPASVMMQIPSV
eukprot:TRINITY_DN14372_c6_g1_i1.p1 TRINITY_DN14372_c6_g1~~TRINITY_DN14372_c6_g1_i1.p1  ORF type:complete len:251 (+),score=39.51 TRINITY_DN14372_c6_g1_i1:42-755(+)